MHYLHCNNNNSPQSQASWGQHYIHYKLMEFSFGLQVPSNLLHTFTAWKEGKLRPKPSPLFTPSSIHELPKEQQAPGTISFPYAVSKNGRLSAVRQANWPEKYISKPRIRSHSKQKASSQIQRHQEDQCFNILSLHTPLPI